MVSRAHAQEAPIDPVRGRQLVEKSSSGETLTPDERADLEGDRRAIRERVASRRSDAIPPAAARPGEVITADWSVENQADRPPRES